MVSMTVDPTALDTLDAGIAKADVAAHGADKTAEYADVKAWAKRIEQARKFDEDARKQYAKDRRYARGDSGFEVDANIIGTNIDILEAFLYARDPDVDVSPAKACEPPSIEAIQDAAQEAVKSDPQVQQGAQLAMQQALQQTGDQQAAQQAGQMATQTISQALIQQQFKSMRDRYAKRQRDNKAFAETLEIVISRLWQDAGLKPRGRRWVRSGLTVGIGIIKGSWQERTAPSPETTKAINDLQDAIKRAATQRAALEDASGDDLDAQTAEYQRQLAALQTSAEQIVARGFVIDVVQAEDFQVAPGYAVAMHCDAPWNAHRIPMLAKDAQAHFGLTADQMREATHYASRKPQMVQTKSAMVDDKIEAVDADAYTSGGSRMGDPGEGTGDWVMTWEIWDREGDCVLTLVEGVKCWAKAPWTPKATTRFYPFFLFNTSEVDGQRHPQSLVTRSAKLADEYNRIGSAEKTHRSRIKPGTIFNKGAMSEQDVKKVEGSESQEMTGIQPTNPKADMRALFVQKTYAQIDAALYDRSRIIQELERIWGVQEALAGTVQTPKTAREAEIQQSGMQARTGSRRDLMESALQELALYTAEVARAHLDAEDVQGMAGPDALWPEYTGANDLNTMVNVEIRAGSSGKPNTTADQQSWATQLPLLQQMIQTIGQLRNSKPQDIADSYETLLRITAERAGDMRLDVDTLLPKPDENPPPPPGPPIQETALTGPQTQSLLAILADAAAGLIPPEAGAAAVQAAYPHFDPAQVQQMFAPMHGFTPTPTPPPTATPTATPGAPADQSAPPVPA